MLVAQGGADTLVIPGATEGYVAASCRGGGRMTFRLYPTDTHGTIANTAMPDVLTFLAKGLAGTPVPSTVDASRYVPVKIQQRCDYWSIRPYPGRVPRSGAACHGTTRSCSTTMPGTP